MFYPSMKIILCILTTAFIGREIFAASPRYSGDSVLLNKRLYYFGGRPNNAGNASETIQDMIYLDISESFNVNEVQSAWKGIPIIGSLIAEPNYGYGMGVFPEESSIMIYGGAGRNIRGATLEHPVMLYNASSTGWQILPEPPSPVKQPYGGTCVRGDVHKAYAFGGVNFGGGVNVFSRYMNIYDFTKSAWDTGPPLPENMNIRYNTPATLVGNNIYYIGGMTINITQTNEYIYDILIPMTEILIYHIEDSTWEIKNTIGADTPDPKLLHTITAKPNSQDIILYGGIGLLHSTNIIPGGVCYVLNTSSMTWKKQDIGGSGPGALYGHSAVFAGNSSLLFVMFGVNSAGAVQNNFNVLDTEEWKWVNQYTSPYSLQDNSGSSGGSEGSGGSNSSGGLSSGAVAGIVVVSVAGVALIAAVWFFPKRRNRNNENKKDISYSEANVTGTYNGAPRIHDIGHFKPEDASDVIPNATLSLLPAETAPAYRGHVPNEINPPTALTLQSITNAQAAPRPQNLRPVKPDGE